jgi:L-alanine-DL-glutamate epimerase-like enolase superfamily enzyme
MKIVDIRTIPLSYRCEPPYGSAGGMQARRGSLLVEIETDERVIGVGEAGSAAAPLRASSRRCCGRC